MQLLEAIDESDSARILLEMSYVQTHQSAAQDRARAEQDDGIFILNPPSPDLAFDDAVLSEVESVWRQIMGPDGDSAEFLVFEDREGEADEDDY